MEIAQTVKQISCIATIGTGVLTGSADGQNDTNLNYQFTWHNTLDLSGPNFATTSTISNIKKGDYSLNALNVTTGCAGSAFFIVPDDSPFFKPVASVTGDPLTFCSGPNGAILIRAVNIDPAYPFPYNFTADLYFSANANPALPPNVANVANVPGFTTSFIQNNLPNGFYTGKLTDNNTGCFDAATAEITDQRTKPVVVVVQDNPLTNCDPTIANGQLSATADNGKVFGYSFQWYAGSTVPASGAPLKTINKLIGFTAGNYIVNVTNNVTGCFDSKGGVITDATVKPFAPTAKTVFDRTSCITPNGWVTADVAGSLLYTFNWYDGASVKSSPDFQDFNYLNRDIGAYTVTATDPVTRCVSPPSTANVLDKRVIPLFTLSSTPAYCMDSGRDPIGSLSFTLTNNNEVVTDKVIWTPVGSTQIAGIGADVYELYPGIYEAEVITTEGCTNKGEVEIKTEISAYNGISLNGDSRNDFFIIDCISLFPNNNVKIFNRSGVKVYEADHYDNGDKSFKGIGEQGLYAIGNQLPDGTYYYIIDKRDGSKLLAGFLELLR